MYPLLYELNTRCWLAELSEKAKKRLTLGDIPDSEFSFWERCGFTHIWAMGVWTLGARGRAHSERTFAGREDELRCSEVAGSPYAVAGYDASRELGDETALAKFRRKLNARGIRLILDFIPNHTALDHPWAKTQPEFFVTSGQRLPGTIKSQRTSKLWVAHGHCGLGEPWVDTLQLDYRNADLRQAMLDQLRVVSEKCDGVRCDMAMLQLNDVFARNWQSFPTPHSPPQTEFWNVAIDSVRRSRSDFLFLAEVYWGLEERLQQLGFDYTYDKRLYDRIIARDGGSVTDHLHALTPEFLFRSAHFIENHDEPRIAPLLSFEEHRAAALLILTLPGMRLLHEGQLTGAKVHANVHFARRGTEAVDEHIAGFYDRLLSALARTSVGRGEWKLIAAQPASPETATHRHFVLLQWQSGPQRFDLAVINLSPARGQCFAPLSADGLATGNWRLTDLIGDEVHERNGAELSQRGLYLDLPPHGAQLFHCERIP